MRADRPRARASIPTKCGISGIYMVLVALIVAKIWLVLSRLGLLHGESARNFQHGDASIGRHVLRRRRRRDAHDHPLHLLRRRCRSCPLLDTFAAAAARPRDRSAGLFCGGCCYGKPTSVPWGVTFTNRMAEQIRRHSAAHVLSIPRSSTKPPLEFLNFLFIVWLARRQRFLGQIVGTYFILYGIERGTIEFFRGDPGRTMMFHNSVSLMQIASVALILTGAFLWWRGLAWLSADGADVADSRFRRGRRSRVALPADCCRAGRACSCANDHIA